MSMAAATHRPESHGEPAQARAIAPRRDPTRHADVRRAEQSSEPAQGGAATRRAYATREREHTGANRVAMGLSIVAWAVLLLGYLAAYVTASRYECVNTFVSNCSDDSGTRVAIFLAIAIPCTLIALFTWAVSYGVLLLASMNDKLLSQMRAE
jgi:hypothetical protein